jgi:uncharacterized protein (DUF849 family)
MLGIAAGAHVRVGLEDDIWWDRDRSTLATNPRLVERVRQMADIIERPIATPTETRALIGLAQPVAAGQVA